MNYGMTKPPLGSVIDWGHPLSKGIVGCWLFNEGQGDIVNDISGNKNHGKLTNFSHPATTASGWNPGKFGKTLLFDGSNDSVNFGYKKTLEIPIFSVSLWFRLNNDYITAQSLLSSFDGTGVSGSFAITFGFTDNKVELWHTGAGPIFTSVKSIADNNWHHIVITRTGTPGAWNVSLYIDGNLDKSGTLSSNPSFSATAKLFAGKLGDYPVNYFLKGMVDNIIMFNRVLISKESSQLYQSPFCFIK